MTCASCGVRRGRRDCPALGRPICTLCCGTKRVVEIDCPETCSHLRASREHPPAVVKRQQEQDLALLLPTISHLTERQHQLFFLFQSLIARFRPDGLGRLIDADVAQAAGAVAATLETASRGVLYEHTPASALAQQLSRELTSAIGELKTRGTRVYDGEVAIALRAIERGTGEIQASQGADTAYLSLMGRLLRVRADRGGAEGHTDKGAGSLILP